MRRRLTFSLLAPQPLIQSVLHQWPSVSPEFLSIPSSRRTCQDRLAKMAHSAFVRNRKKILTIGKGIPKHIRESGLLNTTSNICCPRYARSRGYRDHISPRVECTARVCFGVLDSRTGLSRLAGTSARQPDLLSVKQVRHCSLGDECFL